MAGEKKKAAILGVTGYTGVELFRILSGHPLAEVGYVGTESHSGKNLATVHPQFAGLTPLVCAKLDPGSIPADINIVFCALPHGHSASVASELLERGFRVIDLSADFRLKNPALYPEWYEWSHPRTDLLASAVYGLPEIWRDDICHAKLLANPGCYPTSILLALAPLAEAGLIAPGSLIIDAKSGVSGAGRSPKQPFHFPECSESFRAYRVASHQHTPEIEQELHRLMGRSCRSDTALPSATAAYAEITFVPHLVPMNRGIFSTIYLKLLADLNEEDLMQKYRSYYLKKTFVTVLEDGLLPETRWVRGTNCCHLSLRKDRRTGRVVVLSAIDNLVKGAAGQAVQNMNIMCGWPEDAGLKHLPALVP